WMRVHRFVPFLERLLSGSSDAIKDVRSVKKMGDTALPPPGGLEVEFVTGARVLIHCTAGSPPGGDDHAGAERIVEGPVLEPVPPVEITMEGGRIRPRNVEGFLVALITNSGNPEIAAVRSGKDNSDHLRVFVKFHNGGEMTCHFRHA